MHTIKNLSFFKRIIFIIVMTLFTISCSRYPKDVRYAMHLAGDNRAELEKVLQHYGQRPGDKLKYQAAIFLIANMPDKYSEDDRPPQSYNDLYVDWMKHKRAGNIDKNTTDSLTKLHQLISKRKTFLDVEYIKADFLINNIERSFEVWTSQPWGKHISFDVFCEEILPYRIGTEPLEYWRDSVLNQYRNLIDSLKTTETDAVTACTKVLEAMDQEWRTEAFSLATDMSYTMLNKFRTGTCDDVVKFGIYVMRALGIPATFDFTPQWPFRNNGHSWNTVRDSNDRHIPFLFAEVKPGEPHKTDHTMAKAYRRTYGKQKESLYVASKDIPPFFRNAYIKDVSSETFNGLNVHINSNELAAKADYVYLSIFDNRTWFPIQWAKWDKITTFKDMGKDVVYLPVLFRVNALYPCGTPFILRENGDIQWLIADTAHLQSLKLIRKYPLIMFEWLTLRMKGGEFQAANSPDFSDAVVLHQIDHHPKMYFQEVFPEQSEFFRFYRYLSPNGGSCNIAELEFYGEDLKKITGEIIGTSGSYKNDPTRTIDKAFDSNVLTFYDAADPDGAWVGMDFKKKVKLSKIRYLSRNDDNVIVVGQTYELMYWGKNSWISLGRQVATDNHALFWDDTPSNALFLLRNLSKGKEERIFTYENGKQVWW